MQRYLISETPRKAAANKLGFEFIRMLKEHYYLRNESEPLEHKNIGSLINVLASLPLVR